MPETGLHPARPDAIADSTEKDRPIAARPPSAVAPVGRVRASARPHRGADCQRRAVHPVARLPTMPAATDADATPGATPGRGAPRTAGGAARAIGRAMRTISLWLERAQQRRRLASLSDAALKDIGVSRYDAIREASKPFWRR